MSKTNKLENDFLAYFYNATAPSWAGNANFWVSLHTADPGEAGSLAAECSYVDYARVAVVRTSSGWTVSGNSAENTALVQFPICGTGTTPVTATHFGIADAASAGNLLASAALNSSIPIQETIQPQFGVGDLNHAED